MVPLKMNTNVIFKSGNDTKTSTTERIVVIVTPSHIEGAQINEHASDMQALMSH